jgi:UDP-N-acetylmuramoylalanine--D-glutamate ligase
VDGYAHKATLEEAIATAKEWSTADDVVLFSPATSSFDLYDNYRERGEHFRKLVSE